MIPNVRRWRISLVDLSDGEMILHCRRFTSRGAKRAVKRLEGTLVDTVEAIDAETGEYLGLVEVPRYSESARFMADDDWSIKRMRRRRRWLGV